MPRGPKKISLEEWQDRYNERGLNLTFLGKSNGRYSLVCDKGHALSLVYPGNYSACSTCMKRDRYSMEHRRLVEWLLRHGIKVEVNKRDLISPKEVDIYLPEYNMAIEVDGVYWHRNEDERINRPIRRQMLDDKGIRLLRFWDYEIRSRSVSVLSYLSSTLGLIDTRIGARACDIRTVSTEESSAFLDRYHLQKATTASVRLGLYYSNKLTALMTFRRPSISKAFDWELARFAVKQGWSVAGAASRLLHNFRKDHAGSLISYSDRRYSAGHLYETLGFVLARATKPGYFYYHQTLGALSRYQAQKHKLEKLLGPKFDPSLSEHENMNQSGYMRVYDCGQCVWVIGQSESMRIGRIPYVEVPKLRGNPKTKKSVATLKSHVKPHIDVLLDDDTPITKKLARNIPIHCTKCDSTYTASYSFLKNIGRCKKCDGNSNAVNEEDYIKALAVSNPKFELVRYRVTSTVSEFKCKVCGGLFLRSTHTMRYGSMPHKHKHCVQED